MKRIALLTLVLFMLLATGHAESIDPAKEEGVQEATEQIQKWIDMLAFRKESIQDEESKFVVDSALDELITMKSIMTGSLNSQSTASGANNNGYEYSKITSESDPDIVTTLQTDIYVGNSGQLYSCTTEYTSDYQQITLNTLDEDYNLLYKEIVELAQKDSEIIIVMLNYNAGDEKTIEMIGKYATWLRESDEETIFTLVFGSNTNIVLKPRQWSEGSFEIEQWNKDLLLPDNQS